MSGGAALRHLESIIGKLSFVVVALLASPLVAHNVVWNENSDGTTPSAPIVLYYGSIRLESAQVTIKPETGEACTVMVNSAVTMNTSLIAAMI